MLKYGKDQTKREFGVTITNIFGFEISVKVFEIIKLLQLKYIRSSLSISLLKFSLFFLTHFYANKLS